MNNSSTLPLRSARNTYAPGLTAVTRYCAGRKKRKSPTQFNGEICRQCVLRTPKNNGA